MDGMISLTRWLDYVFNFLAIYSNKHSLNNIHNLLK